MRKHTKKIFLMLALVASLSVTGLALGQSSTNFDLGCSGVFSAAGGITASPSFRLFNSVSQIVAGRASSPNFNIRLGHIQDWSTASLTTAAQPHLTPEQPGSTLFFPFIAKFVPVIRQCSW